MFYKQTQCESCKNIQCSSYGKRNINFNATNICSSYLKDTIKIFDDYRFVQHGDFNNKKCYSLINEKKEKIVQFEVLEDKNIYRMVRNKYEWNKSSDIDDMFDKIESICNSLTLKEIEYLLEIFIHTDTINIINKVTKEENNTGWFFIFELLDLINEEDTEIGYSYCKKLENLIISEQNPYCAFTLAANFPGISDISSLQQIIADWGDFELICDFTRNVPYTDYEKFKKVIIKKNEAYHLYKFAITLEENDQNADDLVQILINKKVPIYVLDYITSTEKGIDLKKYEKFFIETMNSVCICEFAEVFEESDMLNIGALEDALIKIRDAHDICRFARNIKGANIQKLEDAIVDINAKDYIYIFIKVAPGANKQRLIPLLKGTPYYDGFV